MDGRHRAPQRVVPPLSRHRIGVERFHEAREHRHQHLLARGKVRVERHGRHAQLRAEGTHRECAHAVAIDHAIRGIHDDVPGQPALPLLFGFRIHAASLLPAPRFAQHSMSMPGREPSRLLRMRKPRGAEARSLRLLFRTG